MVFESKEFGFTGSFTLTKDVEFHTINQSFDGANSGHQTPDPYFVYPTTEDALYYDDSTADPGYFVVATVGANSDAVTADDVEVFQSTV